MTQSPGPEYEEHKTFIEATELIHKAYHCDTQEEAIHVFRETTLGRDDLLGHVLSALFANMTLIAAIAQTDVCHYLHEIARQESIQWN